MKTYNLVCIAPDGEHVTECRNKTFDECVKQSEDMGSRWYFYPFHAITTPAGRKVVDVPYEEIKHMEGKSLTKLKDLIATGALNYILEY